MGSVPLRSCGGSGSHALWGANGETLAEPRGFREGMAWWADRRLEQTALWLQLQAFRACGAC